MVTDITGSRSARTGSMLRSLLAGGIALAALGAGIITLQGNASSPDRAAPETAGGTTASAARSDAPAAVYLVDSAEAAVEVQNRMAALTPDGMIRDARVVVAGTPLSDAEAWSTIGDLRERHGAGSIRVIDLRSPDLAGASAAPPCAVTPPDVVTFSAC